MFDNQEFQTIKSLMDERGIHAKRAYGQNFLIDRNKIEEILSKFDFKTYDTVVEIGPGLGALTLPISERAKSVIAVEADRDMVALLTERLQGKSNVTIVPSPFEHWDQKGISGRLAVIGNLPYNLTTKLLELAVQMKASDLGFMVQKEVADKITYTAKQKAWSALAGYLHLLGSIGGSIQVPRGCFYPVPGVDSAFVKLNITASVPFSAYLGFKKLLLTPNKKLSNVIPQIVHDPDKRALIDEKFADILGFRAHQLTPEQLLPLALLVGEKQDRSII